MQEDSVGGAKYFLCLKDDYSRYRRVFFLKSKVEVVNCLKTFLNEADVAGHTIKEFLCDGGKGFNNKDVRSVLESKGINLRVVMPYTEQNGCAERENRTLVESARTMIHAKKLPIKLWAEAVNTAAYVINRTGLSTVKDKTPMDMCSEKEHESIEHFRVFGTECYVHVPKQCRRKWNKKSVPGHVVGYCGEKDGYRVWIETEDKVVLSRDVIFMIKSVTDTTHYESAVSDGPSEESVKELDE